MKKRAILGSAVSLALCAITPANAAVGNLLWEDNFDSLNPDTWSVDIGDGCDQGLCGWGNQELQWYAESNTYIEDVPGETGNKALVLEARDETIEGYAFTSGKVQSSDKIAVQYGMIEVRMQVPDVGIGLWPAAWMLGTTSQSWPAKGEIDMMEMGHKAQAREDAGFPGADINSYVGSNLIFYTDAACSDGNPTCAASLAWQNDNAHVSTSPLTNRFVTYRTYWTETEIRFTVEDNGVEIDMFDAPFTITEEASEFQAPFYLLLNLAVGGNFTDAISNDQVTAQKPAKMYIDYVRVYELDGQGEVFIGNQTVPEVGTFGIFTDNTPTNNKLEAGENADIYVWNTNSVSTGNLTAIEGDNVIAWDYVASNEWFGGGIQTRQARDLSNFAEEGELTFSIKIPADVAFKVGIEDSYTNQHWVDFPANTTTYGLVRDGEWATASIPAADIRGDLIALQSLEGMFYIASIDGQLPTAPFEMAIDDIVWTGGGDSEIVSDTDGDGINDALDNCTNTPAGTTVDSNGCTVIVVTDSDNDGVLDTADLCPNTEAGMSVDATGCKIITAKSELIQAEDYTSFTDTTTNNIGGEYRTDAVDVQVTTDTDGGYNVGWIATSETLDYTVELGAGTYEVSARVAAKREGSYSVDVNGKIIGSQDVAANGWQKFTTQVVGSMTVEAGEHTIRLTADNGGFNLNWLNIELTEVAPVVEPVEPVAPVEPTEPVNTDADKLGVITSSATSITFFVNAEGWADVHYRVNGGGQQNVRMSHFGSSNTKALSGLVAGDVVAYSFTYLDDDGAVKSADWASYTVAGEVVITDNDNDGVLDTVDQCLTSAAGVTVDATGCEVVVSEKLGLTTSSTSSVAFFVNTVGWADVHYIVNGGGQQNVRMSNSGTSNTKTLSGLTDGDVIDYSFTYLDDDGSVQSPTWVSHKFVGAVVVIDSDNDGVNDTIDQCANTPVTTVVDAVGCAVIVDTDNDGVFDNVDQCNNTESGVEVDATGCAIAVSVDTDNDGVDDAIDQCLTSASGVVVDATGCEVIYEKFGVSVNGFDSVNFFINITGWADVHYIVNNGGQQNVRMTQSTDGESTYSFRRLDGLFAGDVIDYSYTYLDDDGMVKSADWVSYTFGEVAVVDTDNDGINDNVDVCPNTTSGVIVDSTGCGIIFNDTDGDGISDAQDQCANTPSGTSVDNVGCEAIVDVIEVSAENDILVGGAGSSLPGHALYVFDTDLDSGASNCQAACNDTWAPVLINDGLASGVGSLGFITRDDGSLQATYKGRPLYFYSEDTAPGQTNGEGINGLWWTVEYGTGSIVPLFSENTLLEQAISFDRGDALVTRFADRGRDRHAKEDQFQAYDHYLTHYWTHRTAQFEFVDYVAKGGDTIEVTFITEWLLDAKEFRAFYRGLGTVAEYHGNLGGGVVRVDNGTYDHDFNKISDAGDQHRYKLVIDTYHPLDRTESDTYHLEIGQRMEFEVSQFLDSVPEGRENYYGTTYLYIIGEGIVPWKTKGSFEDPTSEREDSFPIAENGRLGGGTTLPYNYTAESDNHFMQMATNLSNVNGQAFVKGRRVHHTSFATGQHDESVENGIFDELAGKIGTHYVNTSCSGCHERNGRASVEEVGVPLDKWVFAVADADGQKDPLRGYVLQPNNTGIDPALGEGTVSISSWTENNGLRSPNYAFSTGTPARFSARLAPQLVGLGLLEAISEVTILEREDENDIDGDGISGKARLATDFETGEVRLGRFGYKARASSLKHQIAGALNTDMGVMTSILPQPDCGPEQENCGNTTGSELSDENLNDLVKYVALLGVRAQRDLDDEDVILGEAKFNEVGCESCHRGTMQTSEHAQFAELRNQTIRPFTDLLLHDMGPGLADNLGFGNASGAEWRTAPLWGLGLSACVTGGVTNPTGNQGDDVCSPDASYLHDGRARTIEEAILWHGGEGEASRTAYQSLSASDQAALLKFLTSL